MEREGVDDYKYCHALEKALGEPKAARAKAIAAELAVLRKAAGDSGPPRNAWPGERYDKERQAIIDWILELQTDG